MIQQLDLDGNLHDLAPEHETMHLFDSAPQIKGQIALDTDHPSFTQGDSVVFRPVDSEPERSGQWWSEEPSCGVTIYGWADGRRYWVAHRNIRPETEHEREMRTVQGYYAEDLQCSR